MLLLWALVFRGDSPQRQEAKLGQAAAEKTVTATKSQELNPWDDPKNWGEQQVQSAKRSAPTSTQQPQQPQQPQPPQPAATPTPPAIDGAFHYERRPIAGLSTPVMAKVRFAVTAEGGKKLPPNVRQSAVVGSLLIKKNKEGMIRLIETPEIQVQDTNLIYQDAVSLRPQIRFFRRAADGSQSKLELVAVSTGQSIEPLEENREYVVRFEISAGGMDELLRLLEGGHPWDNAPIVALGPSASDSDVYEMIVPRVVIIRSFRDKTPIAAGSGFVLDPGDRGLRTVIVTNEHVIHGASIAEVHTHGGGSYKVMRVLAVDEDRDIAVLPMPPALAGTPGLMLADAPPKVGDPVFALGSPLGLEFTFTKGIVSQLRRNFGPYGSVVQSDVSLSPGSSGGPLVNRRGQVVGVNTLASRAVAEAHNLNFAVSAEEIAAVCKRQEPCALSELKSFWEYKPLEAERKETARPVTPRNVYAGTGGGHWIDKNIDQGEYLVLEDDSLWKVDPLDTSDTSLWLETSDITVAKSTDGSPGYDYVLINTDDREKAHAKYMGDR